MQTPPILTDPELEPRALEHLRTYFSSYVGRHFNLLGSPQRGGDDLNRVTAEDLVALTMLAVQVSGKGAATVLFTKADRIAELLTAIPAEVDLWEPGAGAHLARGKASWELGKLLIDDVDSFGAVATSKLLARKRPRLIPVYDSVISWAFGGYSNEQWQYWPEQLLSADMVERLRSWHAEAGLDERIPLLRVLDVVVWMEYHEQVRAGGGSYRSRW